MITRPCGSTPTTMAASGRGRAGSPGRAADVGADAGAARRISTVVPGGRLVAPRADDSIGIGTDGRGGAAAVGGPPGAAPFNVGEGAVGTAGRCPGATAPLAAPARASEFAAVGAPDVPVGAAFAGRSPCTLPAAACGVGVGAELADAVAVDVAAVAAAGGPVAADGAPDGLVGGPDGADRVAASDADVVPAGRGPVVAGAAAVAGAPAACSGLRATAVKRAGFDAPVATLSVGGAAGWGATVGGPRLASEPVPLRGFA
ncbi:MAG: hypothetical protein JNK67_02615 [Alphaproteobacteria bacterium]|nr:hypothetical protein [Alphaproteobacteria bacterium]